MGSGRERRKAQRKRRAALAADPPPTVGEMEGLREALHQERAKVQVLQDANAGLAAMHASATRSLYLAQVGRRDAEGLLRDAQEDLSHAWGEVRTLQAHLERADIALAERRHRISNLEAELRFWQATAAATRRALEAFEAAKAGASVATTFTKNEWRLLMGLVHPDRHPANQERATEAARLLLRLRPQA